MVDLVRLAPSSSPSLHQPIFIRSSLIIHSQSSNITTTTNNNNNNNKSSSHTMFTFKSYLKSSSSSKYPSSDTADKATGSSVVSTYAHLNQAEQAPPAFSNELCPPAYAPVGTRRKIIVRRQPGDDNSNYALIHSQMLEKTTRKV